MKYDYISFHCQPAMRKWRLTFEIILEPVEVVVNPLAERIFRDLEVSAQFDGQTVRGHLREQRLLVRAVENDSLAEFLLQDDGIR